MSEPVPMPPRTVEELQRLRDDKRSELAAIENELATAEWLAEYDRTQA